MEDEKPKESTGLEKSERAKSDAVLKQDEYARMRFGIKKAIELGNFNPENPSDNLSLTPMEHKFMGSTTDGWGYHPNLPYAFVGGSSLETINRVRERINSDGGGEFVCKTLEGKYVYIIVEILSLTEAMINSTEPVMAIRITGAKSLSGEKIEIPTNVEVYLKNKMHEAQTSARIVE